MGILAEETLRIAVFADDYVIDELIGASKAKLPLSEFLIASSEEALQKILQSGRIDCVVLDYDSGGDNGLAVKKRLDDSDPDHPPTIMVSDDGREITAIRAFRIGVNDYLPKNGISPHVFVECILRVVEHHRSLLYSRSELSRLLAASTIDTVTGLEGRTRIDERLAHLLSLQPIARKRYQLVSVEMVEYKSLTDRFSLKEVDQATRLFAKKIQSLIRASDICGRYAANQFLAIVDLKSKDENADQVCQRINSGLSVNVNFAAAKFILTGYATLLCVANNGVNVSSVSECDRITRVNSASMVQLKTEQDSAGPDSAVERVSGHRVFLDSSSVATKPCSNIEDLQPDERRSALRRRIFKRGLIYLSGTSSTFNCTLRNISTTGVCLRLESPFAIPDTFDLEIFGSGRRQGVQVRWKSLLDIGAEFDLPLTASSPDRDQTLSG